MSFFQFDVYSDFFTPQEFPVEVLNVAKKNDVVTCCLTPPAKHFLAFMLFKEYYYKSDGISVFIQEEHTQAKKRPDLGASDDDTFENNFDNNGRSRKSGSACTFPFVTLSCIPTVHIKSSDDCKKKIPPSSVVLCNRQAFIQLSSPHSENYNSEFVENLMLVVVDNVHEALKCPEVRGEFQKVLHIVRSCNAKRIEANREAVRQVFLTVSLLHYYGQESSGFWRMEETFRKLEKLCGAKVDTTSDIVALLRYSNPPAERIIPVSPHIPSDVSFKVIKEVKTMIEKFRKFLNNHTYDPAEALGYNPKEYEEFRKMEKLERLNAAGEQGMLDDEDNDVDSLAEELKKIPNPRTEPLQVLQDFESILDLLGPWCANRALCLLNNHVMNLKVRVPYVRHYVLLGAVHTRFVWIQGIFNEAFEDFEPVEVLENFSSPKLVSLLQILRRFDLTTPHESKAQREREAEEDEEDSENELTVADYLEQQKQAEAQEAASRGGKFFGRRKNFRSKADVATEKERRKQFFLAKKKVQFQENQENETPVSKESQAVESVKEIDQPAVQIAQHHESPKETVKEISVSEADNLSTPTSSTIETETSKLNESTTPVRPAGKYQRRNKFANKVNEDTLCGILLCEDRFVARLLYHFLKEAADVDKKLLGLNPTIAISSNPDFSKDSREAEMEYKKREESLRKFRYREANFLVGTSLLEDGIELPKSNLVIRFDESKSFRSYLFSRGRAQGQDAEYYIFTPEPELPKCLSQLATYKAVEEALLSHTIIPRPTQFHWTLEKEREWNKIFPQFKCASLANAISIVNRYCARLPSDTFTRLTPSWQLEVSSDNGSKIFTCSLRLPINSPVKWTVKGVPMPSDVLAKKAAALQTVVVLHANRELDDSLMPVGKEGVSLEPDLPIGESNVEDEYGEFRPGSTRRRQYYDKNLAPELMYCLPEVGKPMYIYWLKMILTCPLPEDQNTRGRKLHPPEQALQSFGIVLSKPIPPMPAFPIYTRCGEVHVQLVQIVNESETDTLTAEKLEKISAFHHYTFTSVLRLDKYLTLFDPDAAENSYYVVPLKAVGKRWEDTSICSVDLDWEFMEKIWNARDSGRPRPLSDESRKDYKFKPEDYDDAVVMPWYRNNDQPQYFYVAEVCSNLTPQSQFPGCEFKTFAEYYLRKYNLTIQDPNQPLLDVDHTSARLNFLTPRYVNRKGMALPTSSENTKKAKRENLEQKQILVPELCAVHPFTASLWRQAVCLPCILYRINCLLLSNHIRRLVSAQIHGLGIVGIPSDFHWDPLSFGWSLRDVFGLSAIFPDMESTSSPKPEKKHRLKDKDKEQSVKKTNGEAHAAPATEEEPKTKPPPQPQPEPDVPKPEEKELSGFEKAAKEEQPEGVTLANLLLSDKKLAGKSLNEILSEEMKKCRPPQLEIGTWSNDMASGGTFSEPENEDDEDELLDPNVALPSNIMMLDKNWTWGGRSKLFNHRVHRALYGSPTHWGEVWDRSAFEPPEDSEHHSGSFEDDTMSVNSDMSGSDESYLDGDNNLKIQFAGNTAEALDKRKFGTAFDHKVSDDWATNEDLWWSMDGFDENGKEIPQKEDEIYSHSFEDECRMREAFEKKVAEKVDDIRDIVKWDEISNLPPRKSRRVQTAPETEETPSQEDFDSKFKLLTPLSAPEMIPASEPIKKESKTDLEGFKEKALSGPNFSFDYMPSLPDLVGPSPCQILQALTMSNANDGLNLERLETIGDSFLKYAITTYLFCTFETLHEGKLSHLRSKQVSNVHLYRLGRRRGLGGIMVAAKFEPHDNWLPPCYHIPKDLDKALIHSKVPPRHFSMAQVKALKGLSAAEITEALKNNTLKLDSEFIPYNLVTQQSIPDKSIADCVEALIGAYLTSTGSYGALLFMSWLGMRVLPSRLIPKNEIPNPSSAEPNSLFYMDVPNTDTVILFEKLCPPRSPLLRYSPDSEAQLSVLLKGYEAFEESVGYKFNDRSYLLQAFTHASYASNNLTDCYQRLEFLGDAILDYLITRHLYEDPRQHSPGSLTDLRSALVNNTIFASLAVKNGFHVYFRHSSPGLATVLQKFVTFQEQHSHTLTQDYYLMGEEECEEAEDIEVPKALGDVFESVAGAVYLDSGMSLDAVWRVYYRIMKNEIEQFSQNVPKSPIRELLELEPETAKFGKPEKLWDGRRVRVTVEIFGVGIFRGIGRNYRIAKCTAAKCALRHVRKLRQGHPQPR